MTKSIRALVNVAILVVEDEYLLADDLARDLIDQGARIIGPVATLDEALAEFATERPDLAVLDINLRGAQVFPLADTLEQHGVPFVFATGYEAEAIPGRFASAPHYQKPIKGNDLITLLGQLAACPAEQPIVPCQHGPVC